MRRRDAFSSRPWSPAGKALGMTLSPGCRSLLFAALVFVIAAPSAPAAEKLKALIIDGQNNHDWRATTPYLKSALEQSGRFAVEVSTTPGPFRRGPDAPKNAPPEKVAEYNAAKAQYEAEKKAYDAQKPALWQAWHPKFKDYTVVVSNYNGELWPEEVRHEFVDYVRGGGGFVVVHAADNSFPEWPEYNEMIGLGGWGGRNEKSGPMLRVREGAIVRDETPGAGGTHGKQHEFVLELRQPEHPIVKGFPMKWKHTADELYSKLRGPAKNLTVLATSFNDPSQGGTNEHEPILMVIDYGKGRVFHTTMGHATTAMSGLGFQLTLARGAEWAATGKVTLPAPKAGELSAETAAVAAAGSK
jgi:type 1 glutamine amidotransferase